KKGFNNKKINIFNLPNVHIMKDLLSHPVDEGKIVYQSKIHWTSFVFPILFGLISFSIGFLLLLIKMIGLTFVLCTFLFVISFRRFLRLISTKIYVTENQLTIIHGIFGKQITDISLRKY